MTLESSWIPSESVWKEMNDFGIVSWILSASVWKELNDFGIALRIHDDSKVIHFLPNALTRNP